MARPEKRLNNPDIHYPLLVDCDPICCGKPFVVLDIVDSVFQVAVPLGEVHLQKVPQKVFQITAKVRGEPDLKIRI